MGLDVDSIVANQYLMKIKSIVSSLPHGERSEIADDIIKFAELLEIKYKNYE